MEVLGLNYLMALLGFQAVLVTAKKAEEIVEKKAEEMVKEAEEVVEKVEKVEAKKGKRSKN